MSKRFGTIILGFSLAVGLMGVSGPAHARRHHGHHAHVRHHAHFHAGHGGRHHGGGGGGETGGREAAIVVDANSGRTLYASNEHALRHPASLTKVMTLYLLFEQLEKGRLAMDSDIRISGHAAAQAPSKLGLRPGQTIEVDDAIKAIVTKSANDVAVAVGETIGGDEDTFAEMMTRKAHALGMTHTHYANASGLPNSAQITSAHDLAVLGRAIQDRFPKYYRYFSTRSFTYGGRVNMNHNHLLGRVEGMDGIKTGYTAASGFNLLTSVRRDGRHLVSVVLGGATARSRDQRMANLIEDYLSSGATSRSAAAISETDEAETSKAAPVRQAAAEPAHEEEAPAPVQAQAEPAPAVGVSHLEAPTLQLAAPPSPVDVARARNAEKPKLAFVSGAPRNATEEKADRPAEKTSLRASKTPIHVVDGSTNRHASAPSTATPSSLRWTTGAQPTARAREESGGRTSVAKADAKAEAKTLAPEQRPTKSGWIIQIGATDDATKANDLLNRAKGSSRAVASAQAFTEKVRKGDGTLWRARFAGLQENSAENACRELKRSGFSCIAMRN